MARSPRSDVFDPAEVSVFHCINRCVRRCFLCGDDPLTGSNFDHRKLWFEERLAFLAGCFGIDVLSFAILSNHFHVVLRNRPDVVATWSDSEVAHRWLRLCPERKRDDGSPEEPTEAELDAIRKVPERLAEIRERLSHISWMMRMIAGPIARRSNLEDKCTGRFWQGRYRGVKLCDDAAVLACMAYVDLNPIRAGLACTLEGSDYTSVKRRIRELEAFTGTAPSSDPVAFAAAVEQADAPQAAEATAHPAQGRAAWLAPLALDEGRHAEPGPRASSSGVRCSDQGILPMRLEDYLQLLDWTGRQLARGKAGAIPEHLPPVLERLGIGGSEPWLKLASDFGRIFHRVAGRPGTLRGERTRRGRRRFRAPRARLFARD